LALPLTAAVALKRPAVLLATSAGEAAQPRASVSRVAWLSPPRKLAPAPVAAEGSVKVTLAPSTGWPVASTTRAVSGR
jgi:hypothetical protein